MPFVFDVFRLLVPEVEPEVSGLELLELQASPSPSVRTGTRQRANRAGFDMMTTSEWLEACRTPAFHAQIRSTRARRSTAFSRAFTDHACAGSSGAAK
jgi:hypothetical protein